MHMYSVSMSYVGLVFNTTVDLIIDYMSLTQRDLILDPEDPNRFYHQLREISSKWTEYSKAKRANVDLFPGTVRVIYTLYDAYVRTTLILII